ncbi:MAG: hypothetical protein LAT63_10155 [Marinobacter sp.]|nr:hypothetical protein [Marinobacter sp.]
MKRMITPLLCLCLLLPAVAFAESGWDQIRNPSDRSEVRTFVRSVEGSSIKQFKGIVEVPQSMLTAIAVISDVHNFDNWVFNCQGTEIRREEWGTDYLRIKINGIWPASDRDVVIRSSYHQDPDTRAITVRSQAAEGLLEPQRGFVRIEALDNFFVVEPLADGWTRITFQTFVHPGGSLPAWIANFVATRAPVQTLEGLRQQMARDEYQLSSPEQLPSPLPGSPHLEFPEGTLMSGERVGDDTADAA